MPPELVIIVRRVVVCFVVAGMIQADSRHQPDLSPFPFWGGELDLFSMSRSPLNCVVLAINVNCSGSAVYPLQVIKLSQHLTMSQND
jgi:hypothetical protein